MKRALCVLVIPWYFWAFTPEIGWYRFGGFVSKSECERARHEISTEAHHADERLLTFASQCYMAR